MGNRGYYYKQDNIIDTDAIEQAIREVDDLLKNSSIQQNREIADLLNHKLSNERKLFDAQIDFATKYEKKRLDIETNINKRLIAMGHDVASVTSKQTLDERLKAIDKEEKKRLAHAKNKDTIKKIKAEAKAKREAEEKLEKDRAKAKKKELKEYSKDLKSAVSSAWSDAGLTGLGGALFGGKAAKEALAESMGLDVNDKRVQQASKAMRVDAAFNALAGFAKQLEGTINDIAQAQSKIDTRLQGSKGSQYMGSFWKQMNLDVTRYVGMSPLVKQADVVNNIKTLVGQGISFDVEQRAFLQTISDKIATTFEATDGTLLKLVRIQQADTTAARLGMESALTSFLNNMYETTEYMQSAASEIRANIYEASALMSAAGATEFEYQVQKWMGSLFSVGFGNTSGLSAALGKLAAGDISGLTEGGYGNLLIMAANEAGISITDALEKGLDSSNTNKLMESMVDYLAKIYNESQGSKVIQQQFANVYGLTASDLKAAASLAKSTKAVAGNGLNYGGMLQRLTNMANSMYARTSTGELATNLFENLKFATASSMANNPVLYLTYTLASMLDDTVGGIAIPSISALGMGTGAIIDLETTVADLMRVGSLGFGLLGGLGKMVSGLGTGGGFWGEGMLKAFGVSNGYNVVSRGTGQGLLTTQMNTLSESGSFVGNSDASDIQNKTLNDANDDANAKAKAAQDEQTSITIDDVNSNILLIKEILDDVTNGSKTLKVDMGDISAWSGALRSL